MAVKLTPPTKNIFYLSTLCAVVAFILYILAMLGVIGAGFPVIPIAFWVALLAWGLLTAGVAMKGV